MKRLLQFIPAILIGLLAGWGVSLWIGARAGANDEPAPAAAQIHKEKTLPAGSREAWKRLVDERAPLPAAPVDSMTRAEAVNKIAGDTSLSPFRQQMMLSAQNRVAPASTLFSSYLAWQLQHRGVGIEEALARLARENPKAALAGTEVSRGSPRHSFDEAMLVRFRRTILREWLSKNPQEALAEVTGSAETGSFPSAYARAGKLKILMEEWSRMDPAAAAAALPSLPEGGPDFLRSDYAAAVLRGWREIDPAAAQAWAKAQTDPDLKQSLTTLMDELNAPDAAGRAETLLNAPGRDPGRLANALGEWMAKDPAGAMARLAAIPQDDPFWSSDAAHAAEQWQLRDSECCDSSEDVLKALAALPPGPARDAILQGLVKNAGAAGDVALALSLTAEMDEGPHRAEAMASLTESWMRKDPVGLSEWLLNQPPGGSRDAAVDRFAELLARSDPEAAARWAETLPDSYERRDVVVKRVKEAWHSKDPDAAAAWSGQKKIQETPPPESGQKKKQEAAPPD